ncbi:MAG: hypothetical protein COU11_04355 [Candidatus Harrisonbacteria bacterium CG10_big_fil_rev_8_21_14_0_10_49_15]|uniref:Four helix bundle protein n=1 Tax=Candidatus Harrisonbacteria bacterium CG10_big_fil_rev_8_21_14_0_10_49_15 TaxID=1974587 RepID=A0A2H0UJY0_9BACT|nr:MAG: hypothetical protein COU11_04355 [Candidatus Harrisonbacteria bacterium CG10_big_fil_rev_8_21_14_0_10_49_15]
MASDFRSLTVWQEARRLTVAVYEATKKFPKEEIFGLVSQLRRSAVSVVASIAEGYGRSLHKDRVQFLVIARGSMNETRTHILIASDLGYITEEEQDRLDKQYEVLTRQVNALITHIRKHANK